MEELQIFFQNFTNPLGFVFLILLILLLCVISGVIGASIGRLKERATIKNHRQDAVKRSKSVILGQVAEQIAPVLPNFPCNIDEVKFIGKPVDFIGFNSDTTTGLIRDVVFIEVKSGNSSLSKREQSLKKAIEDKKVSYVEYRIP